MESWSCMRISEWRKSSLRSSILSSLGDGMAGSLNKYVTVEQRGISQAPSTKPQIPKKSQTPSSNFPRVFRQRSGADWDLDFGAFQFALSKPRAGSVISPRSEHAECLYQNLRLPDERAGRRSGRGPTR